MKKRALKIGVLLLVLGGALYGGGKGNQARALGLLLGGLGVFYVAWERGKLVILEGGLVLHNRSLAPAYRATRSESPGYVSGSTCCACRFAYPSFVSSRLRFPTLPAR